MEENSVLLNRLQLGLTSKSEEAFSIFSSEFVSVFLSRSDETQLKKRFFLHVWKNNEFCLLETREVIFRFIYLL